MLVALYLATRSAPTAGQPDHRLVGFIVCAVIALALWLATKRNGLVGITLVVVMVWLANGLRTV